MEQPGLVQYLRLLKIHHIIFFRRHQKIVGLEHENSCRIFKTACLLSTGIKIVI